jgi:ferrochelatase
VVARLGLKENEWSLCYQSRFGTVTWLQPYAIDTLKDLAARGIRRLTVVSPSFAVDCLETLQEVAIEYAHDFSSFGGEKLTLVPALNDDDRHADFLVSVIRSRLGGWTAD